MRKYTDSTFDCPKCGKKNYFLVTVVKKNTKCFYLTKCPRCSTYDDVREITETEFESFRPRTEQEG